MATLGLWHANPKWQVSGFRFPALSEGSSPCPLKIPVGSLRLFEGKTKGPISKDLQDVFWKWPSMKPSIRGQIVPNNMPW